MSKPLPQRIGKTGHDEVPALLLISVIGDWWLLSLGLSLILFVLGKWFSEGWQLLMQFGWHFGQ